MSAYDPHLADQKYHNPQGAMMLHPQQQRRLSSNTQVQPYYQQPTYQTYAQDQQPPYQPYAQAPQPPYQRQYSHQSYTSQHSHRSHHSHHSQRDDDAYQDDHELEHRPTFGDTLALIWGIVVGALTGKRR